MKMCGTASGRWQPHAHTKIKLAKYMERLLAFGAVRAKSKVSQRDVGRVTGGHRLRLRLRLRRWRMLKALRTARD